MKKILCLILLFGFTKLAISQDYIAPWFRFSQENNGIILQVEPLMVPSVNDKLLDSVLYCGKDINQNRQVITKYYFKYDQYRNIDSVFYYGVDHNDNIFKLGAVNDILTDSTGVIKSCTQYLYNANNQTYTPSKFFKYIYNIDGKIEQEEVSIYNPSYGVFSSPSKTYYIYYSGLLRKIKQGSNERRLEYDDNGCIREIMSSESGFKNVFNTSGSSCRINSIGIIDNASPDQNPWWKYQYWYNNNDKIIKGRSEIVSTVNTLWGESDFSYLVDGNLYKVITTAFNSTSSNQVDTAYYYYYWNAHVIDQPDTLPNYSTFRFSNPYRIGDVINLENFSGLKRFSVYSINGKCVYSIVPANKEIILPYNLKQGLYFIVAESKEKTLREKIIILPR